MGDAASGTTDGGQQQLLTIGHVVKPHGLRGAVVVSLTTNRTERMDAGSRLVTSDGRWLEIERSSAGAGRFVVWFKGVEGIDQAEALRGSELSAPPLHDPDALWVHELIGAEVVAADGTALGTVRGVEANPASDLLVIDRGLIPLRFVVDVQAGERITVDVPDGLFDLT